MPKLKLYRVLKTFPKGPSPNSPEFPKGCLVEGYVEDDPDYIVVPMEHGRVHLLAEHLELVGGDGDGVPIPPAPKSNISDKDISDLLAATASKDPKFFMSSVTGIGKSFEEPPPQPHKPSKKKYPVLKIKKAITKETSTTIPFDLPEGTVIDINTLPQIMIDPLMQIIKTLPPENEFIDIEYPEQELPPSLSDAIKQGSEDSDQLIGGYFEPAMLGPSTDQIAYSPATSAVDKFKNHPAQLYSSFTVMGNDAPASQAQNLFTNSLGQGSPKHHYGTLDIMDTNMYVSGMLPLGKKFYCNKLQIFSNLPTDNASVMTFLSGVALGYGFPTYELILGTLPMYLQPQEFKFILEPGMDFRFKAQWNKEAQVQFHEEFKDPWWMQYVPTDKKTPPRYLTVHVVMKGVMSNSI